MNGAKRFSRNFQIKVYSYSTEWFPFKYRVNLVAAAHEQRSGHNVEQVESLVRSHKDIKQAQRADAYYLGQ